MTARILARAYEPGSGMCSVESIGRDFFRLIPDNPSKPRRIKHRAHIRFRKAAS